VIKSLHSRAPSNLVILLNMTDDADGFQCSTGLLYPFSLYLQALTFQVFAGKAWHVRCLYIYIEVGLSSD